MCWLCEARRGFTVHAADEEDDTTEAATVEPAGGPPPQDRTPAAPTAGPDADAGSVPQPPEPAPLTLAASREAARGLP